MYGPAARRKRFRRSVGCGSCINVSGLTLEHVVLRAIMDISAHAISLASRPRPGHLGHQCSHAPGRPILHLVSSSRRPRRVTGVEVTSSIAPHLVQFLCSCLAAVPSSRPALVRRRRAQGAVKVGRRTWLTACSGIARPYLDGPEHGATLTPVGASSYPSQHIRSCAPC